MTVEGEMTLRRPCRVLLIGMPGQTDAPGRSGDMDWMNSWFARLRAELGEEFEVLSEAWDGCAGAGGESELESILCAHRPLDWIVLLAVEPSGAAGDFVRKLGFLIDGIRAHPLAGRGCAPPQVLLAVLPAARSRTAEGAAETGVSAAERMAREKACAFVELRRCAHLASDGSFPEGVGEPPVGDAAERIRMGTLLAAMPGGGAADWNLDGGNSELYMRFDKALRSAQGMDVWEDRAYILYDTGVCAVYDLQSRRGRPIDSFPLGSYNEGKPSREYLNHANSCMFSAIHYEGNPIPLLYVTTGTGIGFDGDGYYYRCAVENIVRTVDANGSESHAAHTVQTIAYHPEGIEKTPFQPPCWGCPAFFADTDVGLLYLFSAKYRTKRECVPEGQSNEYVITQFPLPSPDAGGFVRLTPRDILDQFSVASDVMFTQGGMLWDHCIAYTFGCAKAGYPTHIMAFDLRRRAIVNHIGNLDGALCGEEIECCAQYRGMLLCNTNEGGIYAVRGVPRAWRREFP